ncbi:MAG: TolC family outer membrane protein [Inquilinaceae bacterium]
MNSARLTHTIIAGSMATAPRRTVGFPGSLTRLGRVGLLGLATGLMASTALSTAHAVTLEEAVAYTIYTNPEISEARNNRKAIDYELEQARGLYLPQLDVEASAGVARVGNTTTRANNTESDTFYPRQLSLILQQMIFDGFATDAEVERQAARVDAAAYRVFERAEFVGLDAVEAYLDVLRTQELIDLARANVDIHRQTLADVDQRQQAGRGSIADVQQARERLTATETTLVDIELQFEEARITYERIIGLPPGDLERPASPPSEALPESVEAAVEMALESNPTIQLAAADIDTAYADFKAAESNFYPTLDLEGRATAGEELDGVEDDEYSAELLLVLRYNLFRGGIDSANRQEQIARVNEARDRLLTIERETRELVRQSWVSLQRAQRTRDLLREQVVFSEEVRGSYDQQFSIGQRTLLDLLDAENELFNARVDLVTTGYAEQFAAYRVLASMGELLATLDVDRPPGSDIGARQDAGVPPTPNERQVQRSN